MKLVDPELFAQYKQKISYGVSYLYILGALGVIFAFKQFLYVLIPVHILLSAILDNPYVMERPADFKRKTRDCLFDAFVLVGLIVLAGIRNKNEPKQAVKKTHNTTIKKKVSK